MRVEQVWNIAKQIMQVVVDVCSLGHTIIKKALVGLKKGDLIHCDLKPANLMFEDKSFTTKVRLPPLIFLNRTA